MAGIRNEYRFYIDMILTHGSVLHFDYSSEDCNCCLAFIHKTTVHYFRKHFFYHNGYIYTSIHIYIYIWTHPLMHKQFCLFIIMLIMRFFFLMIVFVILDITRLYVWIWHFYMLYVLGNYVKRKISQLNWSHTPHKYQSDCIYIYFGMYNTDLLSLFISLNLF